MKLWWLLKLRALYRRIGSYLDWQEWACPMCGEELTVLEICECDLCDKRCCSTCLTSDAEGVTMCRICLAEIAVAQLKGEFQEPESDGYQEYTL